MELLQTIETDVSRCLPEVASLREASAQRSLAHLLFVWSSLNPRIGYRQGMHELAGVLWIVREADSLTRSSNGQSDAAGDVLDERYVEHDAYGMFDALMTKTEDFYQWQAGETASTSSGTAPPYQPPILQRCASVSSSLKRCDPLLATHLFSLGIESQLYLLRWMRLLFLREFSLGATLELWDVMFSQHGGPKEDDRLEATDWVCIALLLRMRNRLLVEDQGEAFQALLHPAQAEESDEEEPGETNMAPASSSRSSPSKAPGRSHHHTPLLYTQSLALRANPNPQTGVQCVFQNAELLGIPIAPPPVGSERSETSPSARTKPATLPYAARKARVPLPLSPDMIPEGLSELARNVYTSYASARPDSAFLATAQRFATAYATAGKREDDSRGDAGGFPERSRLDDLERRRREGERGGGIVQVQQQSVDETGQGPSIASVPARDRDGKMGEALAAVISALEKDWQGERSLPQQENDPASPATSQKQARYVSALTTLKHVRDVLTGREANFDEAGTKATLAALQDSSEGEAADRTATSSPKAVSKSPTASRTSPTSRPAESRPEPPLQQPAASPPEQHHVSASLPRTTLPRARGPPPIKEPPSSTPMPARSEDGTAPQPAARGPAQAPVTPKARPSDPSGGDPLGVL